MSSDLETFKKFIDPLYKYINETTSRVPISDWHHTDSGKWVGFRARSVSYTHLDVYKRQEILRKLHIQSAGFSKYCIGSALTVSHLKCNRLKPKLRMLNKICLLYTSFTCAYQ